MKIMINIDLRIQNSLFIKEKKILAMEKVDLIEKIKYNANQTASEEEIRS